MPATKNNSAVFLADFLDYIDPEKTLDRGKVGQELFFVSLLSALVAIKHSDVFTPSQLEQVKQMYLSKQITVESLYEICQNEEQKNFMITTLFTEKEKVVKQWVKAHVDALPIKKQEEVYKEFPQLINSIS